MNSAKVSVHARFAPKSFLENIAVRSDNSILVTQVDFGNNGTLWLIPRADKEVEPKTLYVTEYSLLGIVEPDPANDPDVWYISECNVNPMGEMNGPGYLLRLDMKEPVPSPKRILQFPQGVRALNGTAVLSPTCLLMADSWEDLIWRVDLHKDQEPSVRVWLKHDLLAHSKDKSLWDVPGVNGLRYNPKDGHVYFTCTAQLVFGRIPVDPKTLEAAGEPTEVAARGMKADDFAIDEANGVAYISTHRQNTIEKLYLNSGEQVSVAGKPFVMDLIGPTSASWSRKSGEERKVAFFTSDGGFKQPVNGVYHEAKVLRVEFQTQCFC